MKKGATTDRVYQKAQELGLDLCPAEAGPHLRLKDTNQPFGDLYWIAMKQIGRHGGTYVFRLERYEDALWLSDSWAGPDGRWGLGGEIVFSLRPSTALRTGKATSSTQNLGLLDRIFKR